MNDLAQSKRAEKQGRLYGWMSGLGLLIVPWVGAGVVATLAGMVGGEDMNPERTFPWILGGVFALAISGIAAVSARNGAFRRGAIPSTIISLAVIGLLVLALRSIPI